MWPRAPHTPKPAWYNLPPTAPKIDSLSDLSMRRCSAHLPLSSPNRCPAPWPPARRFTGVKRKQTPAVPDCAPSARACRCGTLQTAVASGHFSSQVAYYIIFYLISTFESHTIEVVAISPHSFLVSFHSHTEKDWAGGRRKSGVGLGRIKVMVHKENSHTQSALTKCTAALLEDSCNGWEV